MTNSNYRQNNNNYYSRFDCKWGLMNDNTRLGLLIEIINSTSQN